MGYDRSRTADRSGIEDYGSQERDNKSVLDQVASPSSVRHVRRLAAFSLLLTTLVVLSTPTARKFHFNYLENRSELQRDNSDDSGRYMASIAKRSFDDDASVIQARMR